MSPARVLAALDACRAAEDRAAREQLIAAAFVGWQVLAGQGAEVGSFTQYLARMGLTDE